MPFLRQLFTELRRRKVMRAVMMYWVVAWTCIEVSSVIEQALALPDWLDQSTVALALAGLPVVVLLAWLFDWSPDGLIWDRSEGAVSNTEREIAERIAGEVLKRLREDTQAARSLTTG